MNLGNGDLTSHWELRGIKWQRCNREFSLAELHSLPPDSQSQPIQGGIWPMLKKHGHEHHLMILIDQRAGYLDFGVALNRICRILRYEIQNKIVGQRRNRSRYTTIRRSRVCPRQANSRCDSSRIYLLSPAQVAITIGQDQSSPVYRS